MLHSRRSFLRLAGAAGAAAMLGPGLARRARAATAAYPGPYWLFVHADGGWDPTLLCDPKGRASETEPDPVNHYGVDEIETVGPFRFAPIDGHRAFFQRFRDQLLVLNGVDTQTNGHDTGTRHTWAGSMDVGSPALGAVLAASAAERPSMAWLAQGGYEPTAGLVAETRLDDTRTVLELAFPDRLDPEDEASLLWSPAAMDRLTAARDARLQRQLDAATLPRVRRSLELLQEARAGDNELASLANLLPSDLDDGSSIRRQAQLAMSCFAAGVSIASCIDTGNFDTHGDHDDTHTESLQTLLDGVMFAMDEAERLDIADKLIVVIGSDFARTPWYNDGMGKDHWPVTSMMMMGPGIRGGRVIGATDERQDARLVDPTTLEVVSAGGVRITPAHVHASLRQLAGVDATLGARFPVGPVLPLLG
jgi:hypothetical protein